MPLSQQDIDHILEHTAYLWPDFAASSIFLTGGTGFFGKWLLESFAYINAKLNLKARMCVLSRDPDRFISENPNYGSFPSITFIKGDVRDFVFPDEGIDFVIHAATEASAKLDRDKPELMTDTIVEGTRRVLDFAIKCGAKRFLLTSSGSVYGIQPSNIFHIAEDYLDEHDVLSQNSAYGQGKRLAEKICSDYNSKIGIETVVARCFAFVGPYLNLDIHFAIGNFIRDGLSRKTIEIKGDGTSYRSYMYMADLTVWLWTMLLKGIPGRAYNVGSDDEVTIADLAERVSNCFENPCGVQILKKPLKGQAAQRYVPSIDRAKEELGLRCYIGLDEAINRTIDFYRSNR